MAFIIPTSPDNVAFKIALSVLLLSVVLHPIVRWCFHSIRANVAWKSVEKQQPVEITKYNFFSEALGDRGGWDTARAVTFLLAAFHVSTWGLELSLDLAVRADGPVDLLNRPPPVVFRTQAIDATHNVSDWIVLPYDLETSMEGGYLDNFRGTLEDGYATTSYRIGDSIILGKTVFASWSPEPSGIASGLFYDIDNGRAIVSQVGCSTLSRTGALYVSAAERKKWGDATECESGPSLINASLDGRASPPVILLNSSEGDVHLIVEEESSYPSFLYSVWVPSEVTPHEAQLNHVFHVSSTTRLVEAVVSGIANGVVTGGGCVDLLTKYSVLNATYSLNGAQRVSPFGEHPSSSSVDRLDQVEPIIAGVRVSGIGTVCGILLIMVTFVGFAGCLCCHSRKSLDVYNRDELIRAISLPSAEEADGKRMAMKIYVRQEQDKAFSIVISDDGVYRGCTGLKKRILARMNIGSGAVDQSPIHCSISRSGSLPIGSRELTFEGVRPAVADLDMRQRSPPAAVRNPARTPAGRGATAVGLIASPVPGPGASSRRQLALTVADWNTLNDCSSTTVGTVVEDRDTLTGEIPEDRSLVLGAEPRRAPGHGDVEAEAPAAE